MFHFQRLEFYHTSLFWQTFEDVECKTESFQWNQHQHQPMHYDDKLNAIEDKELKDLEIEKLERMSQLKYWMDRILDELCGCNNVSFPKTVWD